MKRQLSKRSKIGFQDQLLLNAGQQYCRMLQREHSAILSTCIKLPFVIKIFVFSISKWLLKTDFTVLNPESIDNQDIICSPQMSFLLCTYSGPSVFAGCVTEKIKIKALSSAW